MSAQSTGPQRSLPGSQPEHDDLRMTFTEHLGELRDRLIRSAIAVVVSFVLCYLFANQIFYIIKRPLDPLEQHVTAVQEAAATQANPAQPVAQWVTLNPLEGFLVNFKLAAYFGLLLSLPYILYQVCAFVFPGLKPDERRMVQWLIAGCSVLGTLGVLVAYYGVFPLVMPYLLQWTPEGVMQQLRMSETINVILVGLVGFAVAFQFPMAVLVLVWLGVLTPEILRAHRKLAIIGLAVVSAIFTPPDPISMLIMLIPLALLYEFSILVASVMVRRKAASDAAA